MPRSSRYRWHGRPAPPLRLCVSASCALKGRIIAHARPRHRRRHHRRPRHDLRPAQRAGRRRLRGDHRRVPAPGMDGAGSAAHLGGDAAGGRRCAARGAPASRAIWPRSASPTSAPRRWCGNAGPACRSTRRSSGRTRARSSASTELLDQGVFTNALASATKLEWILRQRDDMARAAAGELCFGTIDTLARLAAERRHGARHRPLQRLVHRPLRLPQRRLGRGGARRHRHSRAGPAGDRAVERALRRRPTRASSAPRCRWRVAPATSRRRCSASSASTSGR